jgi:hypothetical protein
MTELIVPRWAPRLARLYSADIKRLEATHAGRLSPGAKTWAEAIEALHRTADAAGPVKGARAIARAVDCLGAISRDERAHFTIMADVAKRAAFLMFATFEVGPHPDPLVKEDDGLVITIRALKVSRTVPASCIAGVPVAYISRHAMKRLFEHGHDINDNSKATGLFGCIGVLGFLLSHSKVHEGGGMALNFSDLLVVGGMHRTRGRPIQSTFYDVRTVLPLAEVGPSKWDQIEQGAAAADVVIAWLRDTDVDIAAMVELIPALPRRDHYPVRMTAECGQ